MRYLGTGSALVLAGLLPAGAQEATEETTALADADIVELQDIVVTAGGFEQTVADAPASVTVITREELQKKNVTNLSDALEGVQGVVTTGVANEKDISIRGLPGQYTLILVDGKRQGTRESRVNGSSGYEQSFIPPMSAIERIEVVRGPMSSLYGSDAMGGVINIITRKVGPTWSGSVTAEMMVPQNDEDSGHRQLSFYLSGPIIPDRLGLQIWGRRMAQDESDVLDGPRKQDDLDLTGRLTFLLTPDQEFAFEYGYTEIDQTASPGHSLDSASDPDRWYNTREHWSVSHEGKWGAVTSELSVQQERGQRVSYNYDTGRLEKDARSPEIINTTVDGKLTAPADFLGQHMFVAGVQYRHAKLNDQNPGIGDDVVYTFTSREWALFAEDEWRMTPDFALTAGLRYTDNESYGGKLTPRIYGVWNDGGPLTVKGGISTGYRTPDLRSTVDGYYYTTQRGAGVIVANPDLKPETSTSYEVGAIWQGSGFELSGTLFRTDFRDKISNFNTGTTIVVDGTTYNRWEYYNVDEAVIQGLELTAQADLGADFAMRASYTLTESEQKTGEYKGLPLTRTPKHTASLRFDWRTPVESLDAWTSVNYHGKEINAGARTGTNGTPYAYDSSGNVIAYEYDAYTTLDLGITYGFQNGTRLNAAIYNLLDTEVSSLDNNTYQSGRMLWLAVEATF